MVIIIITIIIITIIIIIITIIIITIIIITIIIIIIIIIIITAREVLDSLYFNVDQEAEEAPAETGRGEGSLPEKLTFVRLVETLIRMINTLSLANRKVAQLLCEEIRKFLRICQRPKKFKLWMPA